MAVVYDVLDSKLLTIPVISPNH